jgi:predicted nucleotidyltransferase
MPQAAILEQSVTQEIVQRLVAAAHPERIILFGSAARGTMTPESDIDLLVLEKDLRNPRQESARLRHMLADIGYSFDIVVMSTEQFEESRNVIGGISYPASKYGKVLYAIA